MWLTKDDIKKYNYYYDDDAKKYRWIGLEETIIDRWSDDLQVTKNVLQFGDHTKFIDGQFKHKLRKIEEFAIEFNLVILTQAEWHHR